MNNLLNSKLPLLVAFLVMSMVCFVGCKKKLSKETLVLLNTASVTAKERAIAFKTISSDIVAIDAANQANVDKFVKAHLSGLGAEATGLNNLVLALQQSKKTFEKATVEAILEEISTAKDRAHNFNLMSKFITVKNGDKAAFDRWKKAHHAALVNQANQIESFFKSMKKDTDKDK